MARTNYYEIFVKDPYQSLDVNLADSGFGLSQVLPVIVAGYYTSPGASIILEQPEIHLHPSLQSRLADLFIALAVPERGPGEAKQIIVETHSDHLIRRLCRRIAEGRVNPDQIAVFWFEPSASGTVIRQLSLNEKGQIEYWPKGFLDEDYEEAKEYARVLESREREAQARRPRGRGRPTRNATSSVDS